MAEGKKRLRMRGVKQASKRLEDDILDLGQAPTAVTASAWGALGLRWQREAFTRRD